MSDFKNSDGITLVDAHVHICECFDIANFFTSANQNFKKITLGPEKNISTVILLAETSNSYYFKSLQEANETNACFKNEFDNWRILRTEENNSLVAKNDKGHSIYVISGRQVVTKEKLEVLALITDKEINDGLAFSDTIDKIKAENALAVIPWGVGKWLGGRGRLLAEYIEKAGNGIFLGDNGGRPIFWRNPWHFIQAKKKGITILPGSDPLPLPNQEERVGSFGFYLSHNLSCDRPAEDLKKKLTSVASVEAYGNLQSLTKFLKDQISIRLK